MNTAVCIYLLRKGESSTSLAIQGGDLQADINQRPMRDERKRVAAWKDTPDDVHPKIS